MENEKRKHQLRAERDKRLTSVEEAHARASDVIASSKREVQRSRDLMDTQKADIARRDKEEDERGS